LARRRANQLRDFRSLVFSGDISGRTNQLRRNGDLPKHFNQLGRIKRRCANI
jgi:hypothetical protein